MEEEEDWDTLLPPPPLMEDTDHLTPLEVTVKQVGNTTYKLYKGGVIPFYAASLPLTIPQVGLVSENQICVPADIAKTHLDPILPSLLERLKQSIHQKNRADWQQKRQTQLQQQREHQREKEWAQYKYKERQRQRHGADISLFNVVPEMKTHVLERYVYRKGLWGYTSPEYVYKGNIIPRYAALLSMIPNVNIIDKDEIRVTSDKTKAHIEKVLPRLLRRLEGRELQIHIHKEKISEIERSVFGGNPLPLFSSSSSTKLPMGTWIALHEVWTMLPLYITTGMGLPYHIVAAPFLATLNRSNTSLFYQAARIERQADATGIFPKGLKQVTDTHVLVDDHVMNVPPGFSIELRKDFELTYLKAIIQKHNPQYLCFPVTIILGDESHANMGLFDRRSQRVYVLEPHGVTFRHYKGNPENIDFFNANPQFLEKMKKALGVSDLTYVNRHTYTTYDGPQALESMFGERNGNVHPGYCALWSLLFVHSIAVSGKTKTVREIVATMSNPDQQSSALLIRSYSNWVLTSIESIMEWYLKLRPPGYFSKLFGAGMARGARH